MIFDNGEQRKDNELGCIEYEDNKDADDLDDQEEEDNLIVCFSS